MLSEDVKNRIRNATRAVVREYHTDLPFDDSKRLPRLVKTKMGLSTRPGGFNPYVNVRYIHNRLITL